MVTCLGTELWDQFPILVMGPYWLESEQVLSYHSLSEVICVSALLHLQKNFSGSYPPCLSLTVILQHRSVKLKKRDCYPPLTASCHILESKPWGMGCMVSPWMGDFTFIMKKRTSPGNGKSAFAQWFLLYSDGLPFSILLLIPE